MFEFDLMDLCSGMDFQSLLPFDESEVNYSGEMRSSGVGVGIGSSCREQKRNHQFLLSIS